MRSSSNVYLENLDHLRALAAIMVFAFHFLHNSVRCYIICLDHQHSAPLPPFLLLEEGQAGVSLFMCLSGYVFAYLTHGQKIQPLKFVWNRMLRLLPLLLFWNIIIYFVYSFTPTTGFWSVIVEFQYYAVLPVILIYTRSYGVVPLLVLLGITIAYRIEEWLSVGRVMELSYYTLVGRADQLLLGMVAFYAERRIRTLPKANIIFRLCGVAGLIGLCGFYTIFSQAGGFLNYPVNGWVWIIMPAIDGLCFSLITICYLQLQVPQFLGSVLSKLGAWSYSIYLNHFLLVPIIIPLFGSQFDMPDGFYGRLAVAALFGLPIVVAFSALTYRAIEMPFLAYRKNYLSPEK